MNMDYKLIGDRIRQKRKEKGLTQDKLAERLDVSIGYVSQVERGITKISLDLLARICAELICDIAELVTGSANESPAYLEEEFAELFRSLSPKEKQWILSFMKVMKDQK